MQNDCKRARLLLSPREAAAALGVSERTLWSLTKAGEVPSLKIGRLTKYRPEALAAWLAAKETGGRPK
jgi:excisionase family DNA binding protein